MDKWWRRQLCHNFPLNVFFAIPQTLQKSQWASVGRYEGWREILFPLLDINWGDFWVIFPPWKCASGHFWVGNLCHCESDERAFLRLFFQQKLPYFWSYKTDCCNLRDFLSVISSYTSLFVRHCKVQSFKSNFCSISSCYHNSYLGLYCSIINNGLTRSFSWALYPCFFSLGTNH